MVDATILVCLELSVWKGATRSRPILPAVFGVAHLQGIHADALAGEGIVNLIKINVTTIIMGKS